MKVEIIAATRLSENDFWERSALGVSIGRVGHDKRLVTRISFENRRGLPLVYNESIDAPHDHDVLLFIHDDVWIHDFYFVDRLIDGTAEFDVIGLAGNRRREPGQLAWFAKGGGVLEPDGMFLTGIVGHGQDSLGQAAVFGAVPSECESLDGVFLAARKATLRARGLRFDPRFDFHFYDLDFCRSARQLGLRLGTWGISVTHQSGGAFGSPGWQARSTDYLNKWES